MHRHGFTLIELLVTLVVAAILLAWGVPNFRSMVINNRISSQTNSLMAAIETARTDAVSHSESVSVCPSTDGQTCATGSDWAAGWIVFLDPNENGSLTNLSTQAIRVSTADPAGTTSSALEANSLSFAAGSAELTGFSTVTSAPVYLNYQPSGLLYNAPATGDVYMLLLNPQGCSGDQARGIVIDPLGQPTSVAASCTL